MDHGPHSSMSWTILIIIDHASQEVHLKWTSYPLDMVKSLSFEDVLFISQGYLAYYFLFLGAGSSLEDRGCMIIVDKST